MIMELTNEKKDMCLELAKQNTEFREAEKEKRTKRGHRSAGRGERRRPQDYYATPTWATKALLDRERFWGNVYEPACGEGYISKELKYAGLNVISSDVNCKIPVTKDFGETYEEVIAFGNYIIDFLDERQVERCLINYDMDMMADHIITNPPFKLATEFMLQAKKHAKHKVALLLKLNHLAGARRFKSIWQDKEFPLKKVLIFCKRLQFPGYKCSTTLEMAWFIWDRGYEGRPYIDWIS